MANLGTIGINPTPNLINSQNTHTPSRTYPGYNYASNLEKNLISAPNLTNPLGGSLTKTSQIISFGFGVSRFYQGSGQSVTVGNPAGSMAIASGAKWQCRLPVTAGARSFSIQMYQPTVNSLVTYGYVKIFDNMMIGLASPLTATATAASFSGWETLGPLNFTAMFNGGVLIEVWNRGGGNTVLYVDNLSLT